MHMHFRCIMDLNVIAFMFIHYGIDLLSFWIRNPHKFKKFSGKLPSVKMDMCRSTCTVHVQTWPARSVDV